MTLGVGLFRGEVGESSLFPYPRVVAPEASRLNALLPQIRAELATAADVPLDERLQSARRLGLMGLVVPASHGGYGFSMLAQCRVMQEIARLDASLAMTLLVHAMAVQAIAQFGSADQKSHHLPKLASGESIGAFALTETGAGSDAARVRTLATFDARSDGYVLQGLKHWVSNGGVFGVMVLFAATVPSGQGRKPRLMALLVEPQAALQVSERIPTLGLRDADIRSLVFDQVQVPRGSALTQPGRGIRVALSVLEPARVVLSACLVGICQAMLNQLVLYVKKRRSGGRVIGEYPLVKDRVAEMMALTYGAESAVYLVAGAYDHRFPQLAPDAGLARLAAAHAAGRCAELAMEIALSPSLVEGHVLERALRDVRTMRVLDGAEDVLRQSVARAALTPLGELSGGAARGRAAGALGLVRELATHTLRRARDQARGRSDVVLARREPLLEREAELCDRGLRLLAESVAQALRRHGRDLGELQNVQGRFTDAAAELYVLLATYSRASAAVERQGHAGARREIELAGLVTRTGLERVEWRLDHLETEAADLRQQVAARTYADMGYPFDVF